MKRKRGERRERGESGREEVQSFFERLGVVLAKVLWRVADYSREWGSSFERALRNTVDRYTWTEWRTIVR